MTYREQARDIIASLVRADKQIPRMHNDFAQPAWAAKTWREEYARALGMKPGERKDWAFKRQVRYVKEDEAPKRESLADKDQKFYREVWRAREDGWGQIRCEECGQPLNYAASHVSHNISRGAHPEPFFRWNPKNVAMLCLMHHGQWEDSHKRKRMKIWPDKQRAMQELMQEYLNHKG